MAAAATRWYRGDGASLLYDSAPGTGALLLERLEPGAPLRDHPDHDAAIDVACGLLRRAATAGAVRVPVPARS